MYLNYAPSPLSWIYVKHESVYPKDASDVFTVTKTDSSDLKLLTNIKMSEHVHVFPLYYSDRKIKIERRVTV